MKQLSAMLGAGHSSNSNLLIPIIIFLFEALSFEVN